MLTRGDITAAYVALVVVVLLLLAVTVWRVWRWAHVPPPEPLPDDVTALLPRRDQVPSIRCPQCSMTSYNPDDVRYGYCGNCHDYTSSLITGDTPPRFRRPMPPPHLDHGTPRHPRDPSS